MLNVHTSTYMYEFPVYYMKDSSLYEKWMDLKFWMLQAAFKNCLRISQWKISQDTLLKLTVDMATIGVSRVRYAMIFRKSYKPRQQAAVSMNHMSFWYGQTLSFIDNFTVPTPSLPYFICPNHHKHFFY